MNGIEAIRASLELSDYILMREIDDIQDDPLRFPTPLGGAHPLWVLGHIALTEGVVEEFLLGKPNPLAEWKPLFDGGTKAEADSSKYPGFAEVREAYTRRRGETLAFLGSLSEPDLDRPAKHPPKGAEQIFATYGRTLILIGEHAVCHRGQVADARRMAGRKPMFG